MSALRQMIQFVAERLMALDVETLLGLLDADHPLDLEYGSFAESGEGVRWPTLGLRRAAN